MTAAPSTFSPECHSCGQRAPIVFRGLEAHCAACGARRLPLVAPSLSLAGQPSRVGGIAASVVGSGVLVVGLSSAAGLGLLLQSLWPASVIGWAVALPLAAITLFVGSLLLFGGSKLRQQGREKQRSVRVSALRALIAHRGGSVTAEEAAQALTLGIGEADQLLTELAREAATEVRIEVDDSGRLRYDFRSDAARFRVVEEAVEEREFEDQEQAPGQARSRST